VDFRSDNVSRAHPAILEAVIAANQGASAAYGDDPATRRLAMRFSELFERQVTVLLVATGTAANALSLAAFTPPWGTIFCHAGAHIAVAECGAPELFTGGARLAPLAGAAGKITAAAIEAAIFREGDVHATQPAAVSISQATEIGTVYRAAEIAALAEGARRHRMALHIDGARFANALVSGAGGTPAELTWRAGVDVLSFGATKNGCLGAEAIVLFHPQRDARIVEELGYRRKRGGHLLSKGRFLSAQLEAYLAGDLWLANARQANTMARRLAAGLERALGTPPHEPVESNQIFIALGVEVAAALRAAGFLFHDWPAIGPGGCRLVTSWDTTAEEVDALLAAAEKAATEKAPAVRASPSDPLAPVGRGED
jgi:threonine aldolase